MEILWPQLRPGIEAGELLPLAGLFGLLLGFLAWSDIFRDRYTPDRATLPLLAAAWVVPPLLFENLQAHYIAAAALVLFIFFAWFVGAWADGDLKIFVSYALLLGLAALPVLVLACFLILLYSIPTMVRSFPNRHNLPKGHRLGTAPGVPGIALSLPLGLMLWSSLELGAIVLALELLAFLGSFLFLKQKETAEE